MAQHPFLENLLNGQAVEWKLLGEVARYEQPTKYIVQSKEYHDKFKTPVLTAGKTFILGYTNETDGIYPASKNPVIIFDDFTTANKWVDFDFKVKSSAMKMITSVNENQVLLKYIYYWLNTLSEQGDSDHKRQWISNFVNKKIPIPPILVQSEIVRILDKLTELNDSLISSLKAEMEIRQKQYEYYRDKLLTFELESAQSLATASDSGRQWCGRLWVKLVSLFVAMAYRKKILLKQVYLPFTMGRFTPIMVHSPIKQNLLYQNKLLVN